MLTVEQLREMTKGQLEAYIDEQSLKCKAIIQQMVELGDVGLTGIIFISLARICRGESAKARDLWIKAARLACHDKTDEAANVTLEAEALMEETVSEKISQSLDD